MNNFLSREEMKKIYGGVSDADGPLPSGGGGGSCLRRGALCLPRTTRYGKCCNKCEGGGMYGLCS